MFRASCIAVLIVGCVRQLPPAPPPPPVVPQVQMPPPAEGRGRLVIDYVEGAAPVQRIAVEPQAFDHGGHTTYHFVDRPQLLCAATPCVADVPVGNVLLAFPVLGQPGSTEVEIVNVGPDPSMYRRSLSVYTDNTGAERVMGIITTSLGAASAITGMALLPAGLHDHNDGLTIAGGITLVGGALITTLGILAIRHDAPTYRQGASSHFALSQ